VPSIVSGVRLRCASRSAHCGCAQSAISWGRVSRSVPRGGRAQDVNLATHREPALETRHHPGQSISLDTNQEMRCASQTAEIMASHASNDEHHMVVSVCACMTDLASTYGATNSERASSTPRVWYDDIFARRCSETTVIEGKCCLCERRTPGQFRHTALLSEEGYSCKSRHCALWKIRHTSSVNALMHDLVTWISLKLSLKCLNILLLIHRKSSSNNLMWITYTPHEINCVSR
jgi:hypothetical protein